MEAPISIISICLPSVFSFIKRGIENGPYSLLTSKYQASVRLEGEHNAQSIKSLYKTKRVNQYSAIAFKSSQGPPPARQAYPMDNIRVQRELEVSLEH